MSLLPEAPETGAPLPAASYRALLEVFPLGFCVVEIIVDAGGEPRDYRFLEVNRAFEQLTGLQNPVGRTALELVPNLEAHWVQLYGRVGLTGDPVQFTQGSSAMGRWFDVHALRIGDPDLRRVAILFNDVTANRREQEERGRSAEALRQSEQRFRRFADAAPAMLWVTEPDGSCSYLSSGWYEYTGQTSDQALGFGWLDAVHPADRDSARRMFLDANAGHRPFELEHRLRRNDGAYRWVIDAGRPRFGTRGEFEGCIGSVIDIHDRKIAEERLELAVNSGEVGLWYSDLPFDMLIWNRQVKEHFGLPADAEVTIDTFYDRLHPDDREPTRRAIEHAIASRLGYDTQYRTVGLDGRVRWIRAIGRAHYDGTRPVRFDGITVDVTELVALREAAESANRTKDEFLAMLGHELRNPLAPILTALQLMELRGRDGVERERAVIERQVRHLVGLVDDLLDVSRITRGKVALRKADVEMADVVTRALELTSPLLEQGRQSLEVNVPARGLMVHGDPARLAQVVANLVTNAAKYTEPAGAITIEARVEGDEVVLRVRDTGIGIDAAMLPRIFDLFVQQQQTLARSLGGLGLGLAIVRSLVDLHGGRVSVSSQKGVGSEFTVRLPWVATASAISPAAAAVDASGPSKRGVRVLVVDDNADAALMLSEVLSACGFEVSAAHDGPGALEEAERFRPDVAVLDLGLPVMDGYELAQRLASDPRLSGTRLIALTGYGQARDLEATADAGFVAHLVKPVDIERLREVVEAAAGSQP